MLNWLFRDRRTGRIVIGQFPNWPLWVFAAAWIVAMVTQGDVARWARGASWVALAFWAADELVRGVNPWRRILGIGTLAYVAWRVLS